MTWRGRSVQCCTCSNWVHLNCSLLSFSRFRILGSSHSWSFPPCFFWRSHTNKHCDFLLGLLELVYLHCSIWPIWPPSANASPAPILTFKPIIPFPPTLYLLPLHPHHRLMILAVSLYLLLLLSLSTPSGLFNGMLGVSEPGALNCYTFFRLIPLTLFLSRNPKAVNRITHNLQLAITRFHYYLYCIHGTPLNIRNQYTEIGIITSNKRRTFAVPSRNP